MKAIYTSYHWFSAFICWAETPQAELAQKTAKFNCIGHKVNL